MTDLEKAARMALEALIFNQARWQGKDEAVTALRQALSNSVEQPAQQEPVAKPYAYEYGRDNGDGTYSVVIEKGDLVQTAPAVYSYVRPRNAHKDWPIKELFDRPPASKPWVGLTDEDIHALMNEFFYKGMQPSGAHFANFARAIEAKLKEKNG
jgi:hypothetical protein